jgi:hypothetical protein
MIIIAEYVRVELNKRPLLNMLVGTDVINIRAVAKHLRPAIEASLGHKVSLDTIAIALHREALHMAQPTVDSLLTSPDIQLLTTYHNLTALNYPKGITGAETIPDSVRFFVQATGSGEHTVIISSEDIALLDTGQHVRMIPDLSALCLGLPDESNEIENLYAQIFLFFGLAGISIVEVVSTFNELTLVIKAKDYDYAYQTLRST